MRKRGSGPGHAQRDVVEDHLGPAEHVEDAVGGGELDARLALGLGHRRFLHRPRRGLHVDRHGFSLLRVRMAGARLAVRGVDQLFQDAAVGDAMAAGALRAQGLRAALRAPRSAMLLVRTRSRWAAHQLHPPGRTTRARRSTGRCSRLISASGMSSERQWRTKFSRSRCSRAVGAVARRGAGRRRQQPFALVVAHRLDVDAGLRGRVLRFA